MAIMPPIDAMFTMRPVRRRRISGSTARIAWSGPQKFVSIASAKSWTSMASTGPTVMRPALLTSASIGPRRALTSFTSRSTSSLTRMSQRRATTRP